MERTFYAVDFPYFLSKRLTKYSAFRYIVLYNNRYGCSIFYPGGAKMTVQTNIVNLNQKVRASGSR
jgi:hypothetical protein